MEQQSLLFLKWIKYIIECFLSLIYDEEACCPLCGKEIYKYGLCKKCLEDIHFYKDPFFVHKDKINLLSSNRCSDDKFKTFSCTYYYGSIKELIVKLKFRGDFSCAKPLALLLVYIIKTKQIDFDFITYVPSSYANFKRRGFNQMKVIASSLGGMLNAPVYNCLRKKRGTKDQIGLSKEDRWNNMSKCFINKGVNRAKGMKVLLLDDVFTTGATVFYCAEELKKIGAKEIIILTVSKRGL